MNLQQMYAHCPSVGSTKMLFAKWMIENARECGPTGARQTNSDRRYVHRKEKKVDYWLNYSEWMEPWRKRRVMLLMATAAAEVPLTTMAEMGRIASPVNIDIIMAVTKSFFFFSLTDERGLKIHVFSPLRFRVLFLVPFFSLRVKRISALRVCLLLTFAASTATSTARECDR